MTDRVQTRRVQHDWDTILREYRLPGSKGKEVAERHGITTTSLYNAASRDTHSEKPLVPRRSTPNFSYVVRKKRAKARKVRRVARKYKAAPKSKFDGVLKTLREEWKALNKKAEKLVEAIEAIESQL
jgi:transposase-like protein